MTAPAWAALVVVVAAVMYKFGSGLQNGVAAAGGLLGGGLGYLLMGHLDSYTEEGSRFGQVTKVLAASVLLLAGRYGFRHLLGSAAWAEMITYANMAFAATFIIPAVIAAIAGRTTEKNVSGQPLPR